MFATVSPGSQDAPGTTGGILEIRDLGKSFRTSSGSAEVIRELSCTIREGEFVSLCGPSGCGKTTLLKVISGLAAPSAGSVRLRGREVDGPPEEMAIVFQDYSRSLMPWLRVRANVLLPLRRKRLSKQEQDEVIERALAEVDLTGFEDHYPWQLSGGMQQRVAIARALAYTPRILLLDEPFASVDAQTRADLQDLILKVHGDYGVTVLLVTHDVDEAVYVSQRVVVLSPRPARVFEEIDVDLPETRDQVESKQLPEFIKLRSRVLELIRSRT